MDYNDIKQLIDDNIKPNTSQDITAIVANLVMTGMIDYTRDSIIDIVNQGFGAGAFTWLDVEHGAVIPYPQMSAGRARVVRIFKDNVEYEDGEATIGGVNGIMIKRHALVICLEATNEMANDGMQETVGDRFAVIQSDNEIIFTSEEPAQGVENKLYINLSSGTMKVWQNGAWLDLTFDISHLSNQKYIKYNAVSEQLESGLITETDTGIDVNGNIKTQAVELENETGTPLPNQITRNGDKPKYTNSLGVTRDILTTDYIKSEFVITDDVNTSSMKGISDFLFDLEKVEMSFSTTNSFIDSSGDVLPRENWRTSELIDVEFGTNYLYFGKTNLVASSASAIAGYDDSGVFVQIIAFLIDGGVNGYQFTPPSSVKKIRICSYHLSPLALFKYTGGGLKIKETLLYDSGKKDLGKSWGAIGHSIWAVDGTIVGGNLMNGVQSHVKRKFKFSDYSNYAYSGNSLSSSNISNSNCILQPAKTETWTSKDIFTYDSITNDFKLNRPIGNTDDFLDNTGVGTYYGALRVLHETLKSLNINYQMICANALKRNNASYTSWSRNTEGHSLSDYSDALEWVANRLSWRFINQFRDSCINDDNLATYTSDGLHPNNLGYQRYSDLWIAEFLKIYNGI